MPLDTAELKAIESFIIWAKLFIQDALTVADDANDAGVVRTLKALLIRVSDTEANIAGRIKSAGQADIGSNTA
jgi:hypothetical protein